MPKIHSPKTNKFQVLGDLDGTLWLLMQIFKKLMTLSCRYMGIRMEKFRVILTNLGAANLRQILNYLRTIQRVIAPLLQCRHELLSWDLRGLNRVSMQHEIRHSIATFHLLLLVWLKLKSRTTACSLSGLAFCLQDCHTPLDIQHCSTARIWVCWSPKIIVTASTGIRSVHL